MSTSTNYEPHTLSLADHPQATEIREHLTLLRASGSTDLRTTPRSDDFWYISVREGSDALTRLLDRFPGLTAEPVVLSFGGDAPAQAPAAPPADLSALALAAFGGALTAQAQTQAPAVPPLHAVLGSVPSEAWASARAILSAVSLVRPGSGVVDLIAAGIGVYHYSVNADRESLAVSWFADALDHPRGGIHRLPGEDVGEAVPYKDLAGALVKHLDDLAVRVAASAPASENTGAAAIADDSADLEVTIGPG